MKETLQDKNFYKGVSIGMLMMFTLLAIFTIIAYLTGVIQ